MYTPIPEHHCVVIKIKLAVFRLRSAKNENVFIHYFHFLHILHNVQCNTRFREFSSYIVHASVRAKIMSIINCISATVVNMILYLYL